MHVTLRQLQIFRAIALNGSTTAAAKSVPLSQSAASAALNELERTLNARLFDRVGKRLLLNDKGRTLLPTALAVLDGARNLETAFLGADHAAHVDLHLFASTTIGNYILPRLLARFRERVPAAQLQLQIGNTRDVVTAVRDFDADLGLIEGPCHASDIVVLPWLEDELVIVASPTHPLAKAAKRGKLTAKQLSQSCWLLREPGSGTRESIKNAVAEGLGVSCLSRYVVQDLAAVDRLSVLATRLPRLTRQLTIVHHRRKLLSESL